MCNKFDENLANKFSAKEIAEIVKQIYKMNFKGGESTNDYYCGITNDLKNTLRRHNIDSYLVTINCGTADKAAEVEGILYENGFNTGKDEHGGNGAAKDSVFVYMYRITPETEQGSKK